MRHPTAPIDLAVERLHNPGGICWGPRCEEPPSRRIGRFTYCRHHATLVHIHNLTQALEPRHTRVA